MKVMTFAAGLAAGYVLGTRAGREKFDQLVTSARKMSHHPTVVQAQDKVKGMLGNETRHQPTTPTTTTPTTTPTTGSTTVPAASTSRTKTATASNNTSPTVAATGAPKPQTH